VGLAATASLWWVQKIGDYVQELWLAGSPEHIHGGLEKDIDPL
jgi:hypothetical protein